MTPGRRVGSGDQAPERVEAGSAVRLDVLGVLGAGGTLVAAETRHLQTVQPRNMLAFAREMPRLRFNGIEPGFCPGGDLGRDSNVVLRTVMKYLISPVAPIFPLCSNPRSAARIITRVLTDDASSTGTYYDERGRPMRGSTLVHNPEFDARVVAETRALLAGVSP